MLFAARSQARAGFEKSRSLSPASEEAQKEVAHAEGVAEVLTKNIVQGEKVDSTSEKYSTQRMLLQD